MLKKHRAIIIFAVLAAAVLTGAFFWGGNFSKQSPVEPSSAATSTELMSAQEFPLASGGTIAGENSEEAFSQEKSEAIASPDNPIEGKPTESPDSNNSSSGGTGSGVIPSPSAGNPPNTEAPGNPEPVDPQNAVISNIELTCTLSVSCTTVLNNMDLLDKDKWSMVPEGGAIFADKKVTFYEGESVFNVLTREMKKAGIQMEFELTPLYNSAYIKGINNLYEFDVGELSGWEYAVNGWFPNYGCSRYQLRDGDVVRWLYTCDLGKDVGGNNAAGS